MVMTILEAEVAPDRANDLERAYAEGTSQLPAEIVETYLVRDARDATRYRIVTVWESRAALEAMRASGETPKGIQMFRAAGADPELSVLDVVREKHR